MMKSWLTNATKKRIIGEIRSILYEHPKYRSDSQNVVNKYSFKDRPKRGVVVSGVSADRISLSSNDYVGRLKSFVMLTNYEDMPGTTIEWVSENFHVLEKYSKRRDIFPTHPGAYLIEIKKLPEVSTNTPGQFIVKPHLTVNGETLLILSTPGGFESQISNMPLYEGALRLWFNGKRPLLYGVDYTVDWGFGLITFLKDIEPDTVIEADYRFMAPDTGPFDFNYEHVNTEAIPGAVLAFGDRAQDCDKMVVVVTEDRVEVCEIFGGKFEVNLDLTVFSKDAEDREKLSDYIVHRILDKKLSWGYEGLELLDVSPGGESEEIYNSEIDEYYYDSAVSISIRVDWETYIPLPIQNFRVESTSLAEEKDKGYLDGSYSLDLLKIGDFTDVIGVRTTIGSKITFPSVM